ncbi:MAG TPA: RDD family protein [Candidatus Bathyarchaeia archaeon]|nr:RDD family protein [Candidatus Bathyarchaeia archaeon]
MNDVADSTSEQIPPFIPLPELEMDYAGLCRRLLAFLVDLFVLYAFAIVAGQVLLFFWAYTQDTRTKFDLFPMLTYSMLMNLIICWLYSTLLESSRWRATLGKMAAGIQVTDGDGDRISFLRANSRFFIKYLFLLVLYPATLIFIMSVHKGTESHLGIVEHLRLVAVVVFALDVLPAAFGESRQALHDRLAGTIVVERSFFRQP